MDLEIELIAKYKTQNANCGYNIQNGGNGTNKCKRYTGKDNHKSIPIYQYDRNGNFITEWDCSADVYRELGIQHTAIRSVAKGKGNSAGGYIWRYYKVDHIDVDFKIKNIYTPILQVDENENIICEYERLSKIDDNIFSRSSVSNCYNQNHYFHNGYYWCYKDKLNDFLEHIHKRKKYLAKRKCVAQYDKNNELIYIYDSVADASIAIGVKPNTMYNYCILGSANYGFNTTGYYWRYADNMNNISVKKEVV